MMKSFKHKVRLNHFSRWTRKGYAAFASLGLTIKISFLSVSLTILALPQKSQAQSSTTFEKDTTHQLEEVEVIGELTPQLFSELSRIITVVMPSQISHAPVNSINDVLNNLAQLDLRKRGPNDVQADLSMRGGNFDQVLILLNGININNPQTGHHNLDLPISLSQIERIEVLSGSASRIYGQDAYSGAVNIITKTPKKSSLIMEMTAGDFGYNSFAGSLGIKGKKSSHLISINRSSSRGYEDNTDFKKTSVYYSALRKTKRSEYIFQTALSHKNFGAQGFYTPKYPRQYEATKSGFMSLKLKTKGKINTNTSAYFRGHTDRFELFRSFEAAPKWYHNHNYHFSKIAGINFRAFSYENHGKTSVGINLRYEDIHSNVLGVPSGDTVAAFLDSEGFYTKYDQRLTISGFMEQIFYWEKFRLAAGFLVNNFQGDSKTLRIYPGVDISYPITKNLKLIGNINSALRQPNFTDLYYEGPSNMGNLNLLPEQAINYEVSLQWHTKAVKASFTSFIVQGRNTIDWVRLADSLKWQPMNIAHTETYGLEGNIYISFSDIWKSQKLFQNLNISFSSNNVKRTTGAYLSHYVDDYLRMQVNIGGMLRITPRVYAFWIWKFTNRNGEFMSYDYSTGVETPTAYGKHKLLDVKLFYKNKNIEFFAQASNIFNKKYYDYGNIPEPGRWFSLGGKWQIEL